MKINNIITKLKAETTKSDLSHKHACVAIKKGRMITPMFHNYMRKYMFNYKCGTAHAEMVTINYLLCSRWNVKQCEKQTYLLQTNS
jgi:hypothetical protein